MSPCARILAILTLVISKHTSNLCGLESLALDVKAMLSALRKLRRNWKYISKGSDDWPSVSKLYDKKLVTMVELIEDIESQDAEETAKKDSELLFNVKLEDSPGKKKNNEREPGTSEALQTKQEGGEVESLLKILADKRKKVQEELQGQEIEIMTDDDREPESAGSLNFCLNNNTDQKTH